MRSAEGPRHNTIMRSTVLLSSRRVGFVAVALYLAAPSSAATAQSNDKPAASQAPALPFSVSGVMYLNYQYGGARGTRSENKFDLARAYLNVRAASGSRDSVRLTLDVYQQTDGSKDDYYKGWTMRVKYAWLQHDFVQGSGNQPRLYARLGLVNTVIIDKVESYWNRGLSPVASEQAGYFSSADAGVAAGLTLPNKAGEVYAAIVNGNGYGSRETDRFKDVQARVTLSPWANGSGALKGLQVSPWVSLGARASDYALKRGTVLPVAAAQERNRYGVFLGYKDSRMTLGANIARRTDVQESADTTIATVPTATTVTGNLTSYFAFVRPGMFASGATTSPLSLLARVDAVEPNSDAAGTQRRYVVGAMWDLSSKTSVSVDVQSVNFRNGLSGSPSRTFFLHIIANF